MGWRGGVLSMMMMWRHDEDVRDAEDGVVGNAGNAVDDDDDA